MVRKRNYGRYVWRKQQSDSKLIPLLLAFGLDEFSVSATSVLKTRKTISDCTMDECKALADKVMACVTEEEVLEILG